MKVWELIAILSECKANAEILVDVFDSDGDGDAVEVDAAEDNGTLVHLTLRRIVTLDDPA